MQNTNTNHESAQESSRAEGGMPAYEAVKAAVTHYVTVRDGYAGDVLRVGVACVGGVVYHVHASGYYLA